MALNVSWTHHMTNEEFKYGNIQKLAARVTAFDVLTNLYK